MDASTVWRDAEWIYESINNGISVYHDMFIAIGWDISNCTYCYSCFNSKNLFGCVWLRNKEYCIFNKQYTKQEYEELIPQIITHMQETWERWEFFPSNMSPFGYNETLAQEYFPLTKDAAIGQWFHWMEKEYPINIPQWMETIQAQDLPEQIKNIDDSILKKTIICESSWKPFRIVKPELEIYIKYNLPLPLKHPDVRHAERMKLRNPRKLRDRKCDNCWADIKTSYSPEREEQMWCEQCYTKEIYW